MYYWVNQGKTYTEEKDTIDNYQALCYSCNANKRDLDNSDFRNLNATYDLRDSSCVMCNIPILRLSRTCMYV